MTIQEFIQNRFRALWNKRITQEEIGRRFGISQRQVSTYLSAKTGLEAISQMKLSTLLKMFPEIEFRIMGEAGVEVIQHHNHQAISITGGTVTVGTPPLAAGCLDAILSDKNICDKCKIHVLRILRSRERH